MFFMLKKFSLYLGLPTSKLCFQPGSLKRFSGFFCTFETIYMYQALTLKSTLTLEAGSDPFAFRVFLYL